MLPAELVTPPAAGWVAAPAPAFCIRIATNGPAAPSPATLQVKTHLLSVSLPFVDLSLPFRRPATAPACSAVPHNTCSQHLFAGCSSGSSRGCRQARARALPFTRRATAALLFTTSPSPCNSAAAATGLPETTPETATGALQVERASAVAVGAS